MKPNYQKVNHFLSSSVIKTFALICLGLLFSYQTSAKMFISNTIDGTSAGDYTWAPTENATNTGCVMTATISSSTNSTCYGGSNGSAVVTPASGTPPYTYAWSPSGGTNATGSNLAAGTYTCSVNDNAGCNATATITITSPSPVPVNATPSVTNVCSGTQVNMTVSGAVSYTWSPNIALNISTGAAVTATPISNTTYTVTGTDGSGCTGTSTVMISTNPSPTISVSASASTLCAGNSSSLAATGGTSYTWAPSAGITINSGNNALATATPTATTTYTITGSGSNGCTSTTTQIITVIPIPTLNVSPSNATICSGNSVTINVTGANTYLWKPITGLSSSTAASVIATPTTTTPYTIVGTNGGLCKDSISFLISVNPSPTSSISSTNLTCNGSNNGTASVIASGGTSPYTYSWNTGAITSSISNLIAGTYTVTLTDANGCTSITNAVITQPTIINPFLTGTNPSCNGFSNGSISNTTTGGTPPYTYTWSNGATTVNISNLAAANYTVNVTDAKGCTANSNTTLVNPPSVTATISSLTNVLCYGGNTGNATVTAGGGVPPYTYSWSPSNNSNATITALTAGVYTASVTDANGCTALNKATITQSPVITGTTSITNATCGSSNGGASITASGGTPPYIYTWSNGNTTTSISNLTAGRYQVTIIDSYNCPMQVSATVTSSNGPTITPTVTNVSCSGSANGSISLTVTGNSPFTYLWSAGTKHACSATTKNTTNSISGLAAGLYQVTVTDVNGCPSIISITVQEPASLSALPTSVDAGCSLSNGSASVTVSGGTSPYVYTWNHGITTTSASLAGISAGAYAIVIKDSKGCTDSTIALVNNTGGPAISIISTTDVSCGILNQGAALSSYSGGTSPYTFLWNNGSTAQNLSNVGAGNYNVTVTDNSGCKGLATAMIQNNIPLGAPICMVTVDTNQKNLVIWNRTAEKQIQSYNIYREFSTDTTYNLVGNVCASGYTQFFDSVADSKILSYTYKISELDSCGKESPLSPSLKTIHLTVSLGSGGSTINLSWDPYLGVFGNYYYIYRDTLKGMYTKYDSVSNTTLNYTDKKPLTTHDTIRYSIGVQGSNVCNPYTTARAWAINYNASKSNTGSIFFNPTSIEAINIEANSFEVYPDPTSGICNLSITLSNGTQNVGVKLLNAIGQIIWNDNYVNVSGRLKKQIDLSGVSKGIYFVQTTTGNGAMYRKVVIQ